MIFPPNTYLKKNKKQKKNTHLIQTLLENSKKDYTLLHILWGQDNLHPQTQQDDTRMENYLPKSLMNINVKLWKIYKPLHWRILMKGWIYTNDGVHGLEVQYIKMSVDWM